MLQSGLLAPTHPELYQMLFQFGVMNTPADLVNTKMTSLFFEWGAAQTCVQNLNIIDKIHSR